MLIDRPVTFAAAHTYNRMNNPKIVALGKRIEAIGDPELTDPLRRWRGPWTSC